MNQTRTTFRTTFRTVAEELAAAFERRTRSNGTEFYAVRDGAPAWIVPEDYGHSPILAAHEATGQGIPDDWTYRTCRRAADALAECDEADEAADRAATFADNAADIWYADLFAWGARPDNQTLADEAAAESGGLATDPAEPFSAAVIRWAQQGQTVAALRIAETLLEAIRNEAERRDAAAKNDAAGA